jgi:hypothetical protein
MALPNEKAAMAVGEADSPQPSTSNTPNVNSIGGSDNEHAKTSIQSMTDDQYPHGLKLALLIGASVIAVFLIALDQVSPLRTLSVAVKKKTPLTRKTCRPSSAPQSPRSPMSSTA